MGFPVLRKSTSRLTDQMQDGTEATKATKPMIEVNETIAASSAARALRRTELKIELQLSCSSARHACNTSSCSCFLGQSRVFLILVLSGSVGTEKTQVPKVGQQKLELLPAALTAGQQPRPYSMRFHIDVANLFLVSSLVAVSLRTKKMGAPKRRPARADQSLL
jgi:hypothetical protein